jgi:hypothetical protein
MALAAHMGVCLLVPLISAKRSSNGGTLAPSLDIPEFATKPNYVMG